MQSYLEVEMDPNSTTTFRGEDNVMYEVDVDGVNRHETLISRLPDGTLVRLDFPRNSLVAKVTRVNASDVGDAEVRDARLYVWIINFWTFDRRQRYEVTIPQDFDGSLFPETLAELPDGMHVVLHNPLEGVDMPLEQVVSPGDPLFIAAKAAGRIFKARLVAS